MNAVPEYKLTDESNHLLAEVRSVLTTAVLETPNGPRLVLTIRTASTTLTVALSRWEADAWVAQIGKDAARVAAVPVEGECVPPGS